MINLLEKVEKSKQNKDMDVLNVEVSHQFNIVFYTVMDM